MNKVFYTSINWVILVPALTGCLLTFCLVNTLLIKPLPYPNASQLYVVKGLLSFNGVVSENSSPRLQEALLESTDLIQDMASYHRWSEYRLTSHAQQPNIDVRLASHNLFSLLGIKPHLGRLFNEKERLGLKSHNAIIGNDLWQTLFDQDKAIIGKEIALNNRIFTVVGVLPKSVILPEVQDIGRAIWIPMDVDEAYSPERNYGFMGNFKTISLLSDKAVMDIQHLEVYLNKQIEDLGALTSPVGLDSDLDNFKFIVSVESLQQAILGDHQSLALISFFSCLSLFVIALINLLSLHYYKAKMGIKQAAMILAVGASKRQYVGECLIKNAKLLVPVMVCALVLSLYLLLKINELLVGVVPWAQSIKFSGMEGMFVLVNLALLLGIYTLFDSYSLNKRPIADHLVGEGKGIQRSTSQTATSWLLGIQMFLCSIILVFCGSVLYQTDALNSPTSTIKDVDYWFVGVDLKKIPTKQERKTLFQVLETYIENDTNFSEVFSMSEPLINKDTAILEIYDKQNQLVEHARIIDVSPKYFAALGLKVVGKDINTYKLEDSRNYPIAINQTLEKSLKLYFDEVLEQSIGVMYKDNLHSVMSIIDDVAVKGIAAGNEPLIYRVRPYGGNSKYTLVLKAALNNEDINFTELNTELIRLMGEVDPRLAVTKVNYLKHQLHERHFPFKLITLLATVLGILVFLIAGVGVYALMSTVVKKQQYEIGVRIALGAVKGRAFFDVASPLLAAVTSALWVALSFIYMVAVIIEVKTEYNLYLDFILLLQSAALLVSMVVLLGMVLPYKLISSNFVN